MSQREQEGQEWLKRRKTTSCQTTKKSFYHANFPLDCISKLVHYMYR
jgi:hypothetical protein